ncbi:hypothetical protein LshimejAT787_0603730 [Lyophyllum shimeji]|uniref:Uncharacterized protein n=1 Tax=Lyophyllum shimeji TaxID=47721 RepID=A0A9P3PPW1_LYOSH|nr:hypothetical protein LshimejAT787_0603730 [Lyophyllum shimeji]
MAPGTPLGGRDNVHERLHRPKPLLRGRETVKIVVMPHAGLSRQGSALRARAGLSSPMHAGHEVLARLLLQQQQQAQQDCSQTEYEGYGAGQDDMTPSGTRGTVKTVSRTSHKSSCQANLSRRAHGWHPRWLEALSRPSPAPRTSPPARPTSLESPRRRPDPRISTSVFAPPAGFTTSTSSSAVFLSQYQVGPGSPMASSVSGSGATPPMSPMHAGQGVLAHQQAQSFQALRQQAEAWAWQDYSHARTLPPLCGHSPVAGVHQLVVRLSAGGGRRSHGEIPQDRYPAHPVFEYPELDFRVLPAACPNRHDLIVSSTTRDAALLCCRSLSRQGYLSSKLQVFRTPWFPELLLEGQTTLTDDYVGRHPPYKAG